MKKILLILVSIAWSSSLWAQDNIHTVLTSIENNNTSLKALRESVEADKLENKTDLTLSNPELGFNYLWGSPNEMGNRTDFSVSQTFDLPTLTGMKNKVANEKNALLEWQYKADRMNILLEAKQYCIDLVYYNALKKELKLRLQHAQTIADGYKTRMEKGDANILEYNKSRMNLTSVAGELAKIEVERKAIAEQLKRLNGGKTITLNDEVFNEVELPINFEEWYLRAEQQSPVLAYVKQEIEVNKRQVTLSKNNNLPTLSAGYMSESVSGENFRGVSLGLSIPLWENKNKVKQAKAALRAAEAIAIDSKQQFYGQLQIAFNRTMGLQTIAHNYRNTMEIANSTNLLKKALDAGAISLLEYVLEMEFYYDTINQTLEAERDYQKAYAELSAMEL